MNQDKQVHFLYTWEDIVSFRRHVESNDYPIIVVDTETDGVIEKTAKAYGIGICFEDHEAFYIPIRKKDSTKWWSDSEEAKIIAWVVSLCKTKKLVGHNIIFDVLIFLYNWNVDLTDYVYSDTILQKHSVDEELPFALKEVAVKYLGAWADKAQEALYENIEKNGGKTTKASMQMFMADTDVLGEYCGYDTILTRMLFDIFEKKLSEENLTDLFYKEEIMPLYREVTIPMKKRGFNVDVDYFKKLEADISKDMVQLLKDINSDLVGVVVELEKAYLDKTYPVKRAGNFPKIYADFIGLTLPMGKTGTPSLAAAGLSKIVAETYDQQKFLLWIKNEAEINEAVADRVKRAWFFQQNEGVTTVFNISSNNHLKWLFFTKLKEEPLSKTETGDPQVDDDFLDSMKNKYSWVSKLSDYRKLLKLKSTYIESILEKQIDAVIYSTFIQFGPPSGRYASKSLNLQNIPRVKEEDSGLSELVLRYGNAIKEGFISPEGYKIVNADYSQLEPRAFAEACGDVKLQQVYLDNEDLYGSIAKNIWKLDCTANEVKKKHPELRQKAKAAALSIVYGAESGRISKLLDISYDEAQTIIDDYLDAYPGLKNYMNECNRMACTQGFVKTKFGRIRHLPEAKRLYESYGKKLLDKRWAKQKGLEELAWKFKSMLNLSKNFRIQGVAAYVVNKAAIAMSVKFKELGIDAQIVAQVHDELTCIAREDQAEQVKAIMKDCMENTTKLSVPLIAEPLIASNWAEAK